MDWIDYREKLGIGFNDQKKIDHFYNRIFNLLDIIEPQMRGQISAGEYFFFCDMTGSPIETGPLYGGEYQRIIEILRRHTKDFFDFLSFYVAFMNCQNDEKHGEWTKAEFKNAVCSILSGSHIPYDLVEDEGDYFIFPKGAKELDDALVSEPLEWLKDYPLAHKTYVTALKQYSEGIYIRDVADNLRKALEAFLQEFLGNTKNLETNKNEICKYLGRQGVDAGISGLFQPLINAYKNINDRVAKHNDAVDEKLLEFLLYQTGVLIRMVISVKNTK